MRQCKIFNTKNCSTPDIPPLCPLKNIRAQYGCLVFECNGDGHSTSTSTSTMSTTSGIYSSTTATPSIEDSFDEDIAIGITGGAVLIFLLALFSFIAWAVCSRKRWPLIYVFGNMINMTISGACGIKQLFASIKRRIEKWVRGTAFNIVRWFFQIVLRAMVSLHLLSGNRFRLPLDNVRESDEDVERGTTAVPPFSRSTSLPDLSKLPDNLSPSLLQRHSTSFRTLKRSSSKKSYWDLSSLNPVLTNSSSSSSGNTYPLKYTPEPPYGHTPYASPIPSRHYTLSPKSDSDSFNNININNNNNNMDETLESVTFSDGLSFNLRPEIARFFNNPPVNAKKKLTFNTPSDSLNSSQNDSIEVFSNSTERNAYFQSLYNRSYIPTVTVSPHSSSPSTSTPLLCSFSDFTSSHTLLYTPQTQHTQTQTSLTDSFPSFKDSLLFTPPHQISFPAQPITRTVSLPQLNLNLLPTDVGFDFRSTSSIPSNYLFPFPVERKQKRKRDDGIDASNILQETLRKKRVKRKCHDC